MAPTLALYLFSALVNASTISRRSSCRCLIDSLIRSSRISLVPGSSVCSAILIPPQQCVDYILPRRQRPEHSVVDGVVRQQGVVGYSARLARPLKTGLALEMVSP